MADVREAILQRLLEIVDGIAGVRTATRNVTEFDETQLPAIAVLEGDEEVDDRDLSRKRPSARPYIVNALPQIYIRGRASNVGAELNTLRAAVIKAVLSDPQLNALTVDHSGVRYNGMQSTLHAARSMMGATALVFVVTYLLQPADL